MPGTLPSDLPWVNFSDPWIRFFSNLFYKKTKENDTEFLTTDSWHAESFMKLSMAISPLLKKCQGNTDIAHRQLHVAYREEKTHWG